MINKRSQSGFTMIELIIYIAIVSIVLTSITYLMIDILGGQTKNYTNSDVNHHIRFISNVLSKDIKSAQDIGSLSSDTLVLTMTGDDITYNFDGVNNKLTRQVGVGDLVDMNDTKVEVTGSFTDLSYLARAKNVGINLVVEFQNPENREEYNASSTSNFSVELRGRK